MPYTRSRPPGASISIAGATSRDLPRTPTTTSSAATRGGVHDGGDDILARRVHDAVGPSSPGQVELPGAPRGPRRPGALPRAGRAGCGGAPPRPGPARPRTRRRRCARAAGRGARWRASRSALRPPAEHASGADTDTARAERSARRGSRPSRGRRGRRCGRDCRGRARRVAAAAGDDRVDQDRLPRADPLDPSPIASTTPVASWPITTGSRTPGCRPV